MGQGVQGGCLCGSVRYAIDFPTRFFAHCHCESCRRGFGAGVVSWAGVPNSQFHLKANDTLKVFVSSPGTERSFCSNCGTSLFFASEKWPGEVHVAVATLLGPLDRTEGVHVFSEEHVAWLPVVVPGRE